MFNFYGDFDLAPYLEGPNYGSSQGTNLCFCYSRKKKGLPISDIMMVEGTPGMKGQDDVEFNLPSSLK